MYMDTYPYYAINPIIILAISALHFTLQNGQTLLHRAAEAGDVDAVQLLIKDQFDVNSQILQV